MTYDQQCDEGCAQERDELTRRAEQQIEELRIVSAMEAGEICHDCGEVLQVRQGAPAICRDCGGSVPTSNHHVSGVYFASEADARFWRRVRDEKRARLAVRMARYERNARLTMLSEAAD